MGNSTATWLIFGQHYRCGFAGENEGAVQHRSGADRLQQGKTWQMFSMCAGVTRCATIGGGGSLRPFGIYLLKTHVESTMIGRMWHGWTSLENADTYERLLQEDIFPGIAAKHVAGYKGIQLFRRPLDQEVEFLTIMWFDSWEAVKQFAGEDYERAYVPEQARAVLARFDARAQHYELREHRDY